MNLIERMIYERRRNGNHVMVSVEGSSLDEAVKPQLIREENTSEVFQLADIIVFNGMVRLCRGDQAAHGHPYSPAMLQGFPFVEIRIKGGKLEVLHHTETPEAARRRLDEAAAMRHLFRALR
jgi:hypothetical protein